MFFECLDCTPFLDLDFIFFFFLFWCKMPTFQIHPMTSLNLEISNKINPNWIRFGSKLFSILFTFPNRQLFNSFIFFFFFWNDCLWKLKNLFYSFLFFNLSSLELENFFFQNFSTFSQKSLLFFLFNSNRTASQQSTESLMTFLHWQTPLDHSPSQENKTEPSTTSNCKVLFIYFLLKNNKIMN